MFNYLTLLLIECVLFSMSESKLLLNVFYYIIVIMRYKLRKHLFQPCSLLTFILLKSDVVLIQNLLSQFYCKNPVIAVHFGTKCAIFLVF